MLYLTVRTCHTWKQPTVGPPSCCFAKWQTIPENIHFTHQSVSLYSSIVLQYSLCANASENIKTFYPIKMHAFLSLLINNQIKLQWKTLTHIQVSQSSGHPWDSSIWSDVLVCVRHAFKVESFHAFVLVQQTKQEEKWRQRFTYNTYEITLLTNSTTCDNTVTSANVRVWKMQLLPPVDMQRGRHHERSTAWTDLALAKHWTPDVCSCAELGTVVKL